MKKHVLSCLLTVAAFATQAQPVIQAGNAVPVGFSASINVGQAISPGAGGANQTWNYSSLATTPAGTFSRINPADGTGSNNYPAANFAWSTWVGSNASYEYFEITPAGMAQLGKWSTSGSENYTPNPKTLFNFPYGFGDVVTDAWSTTDGSFGTVVRTYDGYGTLITPFGTYQNVVRMTTTGSASSTIWFNSNPVFPILQSEDNLTIVLSDFVNAAPENRSEIALSVYPNPASDFLIVQASEEIAGIRVFNSLGLQVQVSASGNKLLTQNLAAGIYQVEVKTATGKTGLHRFLKL